MKLDELLNNPIELTEETSDDDAQALWSELVRILKQNESRLKEKSGKESSHSIGGNFRAVVSGKVEIRKNYHESGGSYGIPRTWNFMLEIGNNIDGKAIDEAKEVFDELVDAAEDADADVNEHDDYANVTIGKRQFVMKYNYASSFCWVGLRVAK